MTDETSDSLQAVIAELRALADESSGCLASSKCREACDRLERINAEMRDYKRAWEESDKAVTSLLNVQHNLSNDNQKLRERLAAADQWPTVAELTKAMWAENEAFTEWVRRMPDKHWSKFDLSAVRLGFELASRVKAPPSK